MICAVLWRISYPTANIIALVKERQNVAEVKFCPGQRAERYPIIRKRRAAVKYLYLARHGESAQNVGVGKELRMPDHAVP